MLFRLFYCRICAVPFPYSMCCFISSGVVPVLLGFILFHFIYFTSINHYT
jgi:hypothetical protein